MARSLQIVAGSLVVLMLGVGMLMADDYVEDVYFWQDAVPTDESGAVVPAYNRKAKEIIFIEDSASLMHPDTVRAIIRDVR